jgi:hypothetical protein
MALHVVPRLDLPGASDQMVDQRSLSEASSLPEEDADGRAVGDRFGVQPLSRSGGCP